MEGELLSFRVVDVHLSDQPPTPLYRKDFLWAAKDDDDDEEAGEADVFEESALQMSKLGLPTSFSSAPRWSSSHRSRRPRKNLPDDQVTPALVCDVVRKSIQKPPLSLDSLQVSLEGSAEDGLFRISNDKENHSADTDTAATSLVSADDGTNDDEASASSCQMISCPIQTYELAGNFINEMGALLLNREPISCEREKVPVIVMAASAEMMAANNGSTNSTGASAVYVPSTGANIPQVNLVAVAESASDKRLGVRDDNVDAAELGLCAEDFQLSHVGSSGYQACWDAYYGQYYFYNSETQESTWEPPVGFESYGLVQGTNKHHIATADEKEISMEDDRKIYDVRHGASFVEFVSTSSKDDVTTERVAKGGGLLAVSNNDTGVLEDASSREMIVGHGDIIVSDGSRLHFAEAGAIANHASCPQIANVQMKVMEPSKEETFRKISESASLENHPWSLCWDDLYSRYYFYNAETLESTWEPPKGFEAYAYKENNFSNSASKSEASSPKETKAEITSEDSRKTCTLLQAVETESSLGESKHQESSYGKESEKEVILELKTLVCEEVSSGTMGGAIAHVGVANCKVAVLRKRPKKAAHYFLQFANEHIDAAASSPTISKYWFQRFHLFSKYDSGIKLDEEGWFSVTPEAIAKHQATRCKGGLIIDAFTGVGGNAIQFALAGYHVVAIDNNSKRIEYAHHNAKVYGVENLIDFVLGDFFAVSSSMQADVVFLSPPWGGPDYLDAAVYDILTMLQPKDGATLLNVAHSIAPNIILFLPRNVDTNQLAEVTKMLSFPCPCEVERNFLNGKLKAITVYYGQFATTVDLAAKEHLCNFEE